METFRRGAFRGCFPEAPQCTLLSLGLTQSQAGDSVLGSGRLSLGGVPVPEGPPGTAAQLGTGGSAPGRGRFNPCPKSLEAGDLHPVF